MQSKKELAIRTAYRSSGSAGTASRLSPALIDSALSLLKQAWAERMSCPNWERTSNNHHALHAPGSVILLCAAVEATLNEILFFHFQKGARGMGRQFQIDVPDGHDLLPLPTFRKYEAILKVLAPTASPGKDFRLLFEVRDTLVHFIPRYLSCWQLADLCKQPNVPPWLTQLAELRLLYIGEYLLHCDDDEFERQNACDEYLWGEMFESFRLAYWCWETVDVALLNAASRCDDEGHAGVINEARNLFLGYLRVPEPTFCLG